MDRYGYTNPVESCYFIIISYVFGWLVCSTPLSVCVCVCVCVCEREGPSGKGMIIVFKTILDVRF